MAQDYPLVRLQREQKSATRFPGKSFFIKPTSSAIQSRRHGQKFNTIEQFALGERKDVEVSDDPRAVAPDRALIFELKGRVKKFETAAVEAGFEWLASALCDPSEDSEDLYGDEEEDDDESERSEPHCLYLTMPTQEGLKALISLWKRFVTDARAETPGERLWWSLFGYLEDIRVWSAIDRVRPVIRRHIERLLSRDPDRPIVVEIDLWYRSEAQRRDRTFELLTAMLAEVGGELLDTVAIPEIRYQAALIRVPARIAERLARREGILAHSDLIMTIRPQSYFGAEPSETHSPGLPELTPLPPTLLPPIAAVIDGYPIAEHKALSGRVIIHEVDIKGTDVPVSSRFHGTAMASLILHGDLHHPGPPPKHQLAVIPVLGGGHHGCAESTPPSTLPIKLIYNALKALKEGSASTAPFGKNVVLINHSICDEYAPFVRRPSPWASLIDYFSHKHALLFVISAGNIRESLLVPEFADRSDVEEAEGQLEAALVHALDRSKGGRSLLSPAEAVNALTVGALHADGATGEMPDDPFPNLKMTSLCSAVGLGINRSVKPDLVEEGGRLAATIANSPEGVLVHGRQVPDFGHLVAVPDPFSGDLSKVARLAGTSNSAALVTRSGLLLAETVENVYLREGTSWLTRPTRAVILKSLLMHSCEWGATGNILYDVLPPLDTRKHVRRRDNVSRYLGYGRPKICRVVAGTAERITLLADDVIQHDQLHEYRIPIPSAMIGNRELRRVVVTLAWSSPVIPATAIYRGVRLQLVNAQGNSQLWSAVGRTKQPNGKTGERGTVVHVVLEGSKKCKEFVDRQGLFLGVQAFALHPDCEQAPVPYAMAVTLEVAQSVKSSLLYSEVRDALRNRVKVMNRISLSRNG